MGPTLIRARLFALVLLLGVAAMLPAGEAPRLREVAWSRVSLPSAPPSLSSRSAILIDVSSRTVLHAHNPDLVIPPASLTKLVAVDVALRAAELGEIDLDRPFVPPESTWAERQPAGSSLMFLGPDQRLTVRDLLLGLTISSGNDAAVALAQLVSGSVAGFAERMNARSRELGLFDLFFVEPSGLSARNTITARAFARFLLAHLERYPEALELYSLEEFTYPAERHRDGPLAREPITQRNRNLLIGSFAGVDGFKTGFIEASGYHLAATAERNGRRLIAIVLGIDADSHAEGGARRAAEAAALLEWGFASFETLRFSYPEPSPIRVFRGVQPRVRPTGPQEIIVSVPTGSAARLRGVVEQEDEVVAPTAPARVGSVAIVVEEAGSRVVLAREDLVLPAQAEGGFWRRLWDGVVVLIRRLIAALGGHEAPLPGTVLPAA